MSFEALIYLNNNRPGDTSAPLRGDIVSVRQVGFDWARLEDKRKYDADPDIDPATQLPLEWPSDYAVVRVTGLTGPATAHQHLMIRRLARPAVDGDPEFLAADIPDRVVKIAQHGWRIRTDDLSAAANEGLEDTGFAAVSEAQFRSYCEQKLDRTVWDPDDADGKGVVRSDSDQPIKVNDRQRPRPTR